MIFRNFADIIDQSIFKVCPPSPLMLTLKIANWVKLQALPLDMLDTANEELRSRRLMIDMPPQFKHPPFLTAIHGDILRLLNLKYTVLSILYFISLSFYALFLHFYPNYIYRLSVLFYFPVFLIFHSPYPDSTYCFGLEISPQCLYIHVFFPIPADNYWSHYIGSNATIYHEHSRPKRLAFDYITDTSHNIRQCYFRLRSTVLRVYRQ